MAPPLSPDSDFYTIDGTQFTIRPSSIDNYDNIQTVLNAMSGVENATLRFAAGRYPHSYQLVGKNLGGPYRTKIFGAGKGTTLIVAGTESAPIRPLDQDDRRAYNPNGWGTQLTFHQTVVGGTETNVEMFDLGLLAPETEGYTGVSYGGFPTQNLQLECGLRVCSGYTTNTIFDVELTMTGVVPQPVGDTNIRLVSVWSEEEGTGTEYVEDTDYTVDYALGTITRIGGGAIGDGATVFASYNNIENQLEVFRQDFWLHNCLIKGYNRADANGILHNSVLDNFYDFTGGRAWATVSNDGFRFAQAVFRDTRLDPIYSQLVWDRYLADAMSLVNGSFRDEDNVFEDCSVSRVAQILGEIPGGSPYIASPNQASFSRVSVKRNKRIRCGIEQGSGGVNSGIGESERLILEVENNEYVGCGSAQGAGGFGQGFFTLPGHTPSAEGSATVSGNIVRGARKVRTPFGEFSRSPIDIGNIPWEGVTVSGNRVEFDKDSPTGHHGIAVTDMPMAQVVDNKFKSETPIEGGAIYSNGMTGAKIAGNDFSALQLLPGRAHIMVDGGMTDTILMLNDGDTYIDNGTDTVAMGGDEIP